MKLLIIDDTKSVHAFFGSIFSDCAVEIIRSYSGEDGIKCLENDPEIAVVLLDWEMPGLSGLETLEKIREAHTVPVIMVTSNNNHDYFAKAFDAGADDYLTKPFTADIVLEKIESVTGENVRAAG